MISSIIAGRERQTFCRSPEECSVSKNLPALSKASALIKLIQLRQRTGRGGGGDKGLAVCGKEPGKMRIRKEFSRGTKLQPYLSEALIFPHGLPP